MYDFLYCFFVQENIQAFLVRLYDFLFCMILLKSVQYKRTRFFLIFCTLVWFCFFIQKIIQDLEHDFLVCLYVWFSVHFLKKNHTRNQENPCMLVCMIPCMVFSENQTTKQTHSNLFCLSDFLINFFLVGDDSLIAWLIDYVIRFFFILLT